MVHWWAAAHLKWACSLVATFASCFDYWNLSLLETFQWSFPQQWGVPCTARKAATSQLLSLTSKGLILEQFPENKSLPRSTCNTTSYPSPLLVWKGNKVISFHRELHTWETSFLYRNHFDQALGLHHWQNQTSKLRYVAGIQCVKAHDKWHEVWKITEGLWPLHTASEKISKYSSPYSPNLQKPHIWEGVRNSVCIPRGNFIFLGQEAEKDHFNLLC